MKKKNAIMLADTRPFLIGHMLLQLQKTNAGVFDEALIYYSDLGEEDKALFKKIMPCKFVHYDHPFEEQVSKFHDFNRFTALMFPRYDMFSLLDEYETVTWIDTDVLIQGSLQPVLDMAKKNGMAANFESPEAKSAFNPSRANCSFYRVPEGYDGERWNMSSGLISVSDTLPLRREYTDWLYQATAQHADVLALPDQGALNMFIQHFGLDVACIGSRYCAYPYYGRDTSNDVVIHAWGPRKFWNNWFIYNHYPAWAEYYQQWLDMGGSPYNGKFAPLISVVIPCFQPDPKMFRQALDSMLSQTDNYYMPYDNFEIIIVIEPINYQPTQELIESYHDPRLVLIVNEDRQGIAKSLNIGLRKARGKYIVRMDDDDVTFHLRFYKQVEYLNAHPDVQMCTSDFEYFGDMNERRTSFDGELCRAWSIFTCPFDHPTLMFRREFFAENNLYYDEERGFVEDWELWLRAFDAGMKVGCVHEVLFFHRWHNGSAGQNNKTVIMMRELVRKNFAKLGVEIPDRLLPLVAPYNGRIVDQGDYDAVEQLFCKALAQNAERKIYNQSSLMKAFEIRLTEARMGTMTDIVSAPTGMAPRDGDVPSEAMTAPAYGSAAVAAPAGSKGNPIKELLKKWLKPLYRPIRRRFEEPLWQTRDYICAVQGNINETRQNLLNAIEQSSHSNREVLDSIDHLGMQQRMQYGVLSTEMMKSQSMIKDMQTELSALRQVTDMLKAEHQQFQKVPTQNITDLFAAIGKLSAEQQSIHDIRTQNITDLFAAIGKLSAEQKSIQDIRTQNITDIFAVLGKIVAEQQNAQADLSQLRIAGDLQKMSLFSRKKVFLVGTSEHSNIGDAAIAVGAREFVRRYFADRTMIEISTYEMQDRYPLMMELCAADDIILLQGGGNLGNKFLAEEDVRRKVIRDFPNNRIVILPQTIYFDNDAELATSEAIYDSHKDLLLFTRGEESFWFAKEKFPNVTSISALDMALMLRRDYGLERRGILLCLRDLNDESGLNTEQYERIRQTVRSCYPEGETTNNLWTDNIFRSQRSQVVSEELKRYARHKIVVTDRLHGLIFSIITGTPCVVFSAYNQKIREFMADFADSNGIIFLDKDLDALEEALGKASSMKQLNYPILDEDVFAKMAAQIKKGE